MSQTNLPGLSAAALEARLTPDHRSFLAGLPARNAMFRGFTMKADDDNDDPDDDNQDDDDVVDLDPDDKVKVGDKVMTVSDLQKIAAREKRQGKKAGQSALLRRFGFDTIEDLEEALQNLPDDDDTGKDSDKKDKDGDEDARNRQKRDQGKEDKLRLKERKLDLRGALRDAGVPRDDLDAGEALLDRLVDRDYDDDDLDDAIEELQRSRAGKALFASSDADDQPAPRRTAAGLPKGKPKGKPRPAGKPFGEKGRERAARRGWIKDAD